MNSTKPTSFELIRYIFTRQILHLNTILDKEERITDNTHGTKLCRLAETTAITNQHKYILRTTGGFMACRNK